MKTISACMICQNEESMVQYSLPSLFNKCDEVVIVDGISADNMEATIYEVAKKCGAESKLKYFKNKFETLNGQRNFYLDKCSCDFIMYCDADEVIREDHIDKIKRYAETSNLMLVRSQHFYIDFWHVANGGDWDKSYLMPRCFKNIRGGLSYTEFKPKEGDHTLMVNGKYFLSYWNNEKVICEKDDIVVYHYGHALGKEREYKKIKFFAKYDHPDTTPEKADEVASSSCYMDSRFWEDGINPDPTGIKKFSGEHPEIIKQHPLYNVHVIKQD